VHRSRQDAVERQLSALDSDLGLAVLQLDRRLRETLANLAGLDGLDVLGALDFSEAA